MTVEPEKKSKAVRFKEARERLNEGRLRRLDVNFDIFRSALVNVRLKCEYFRGRRTLTLADLGLDKVNPDIRMRIEAELKLGSQKVMRNSDLTALSTCENRSRQILRENGIASPWKGFLIPEMKYPAVKAALGEWQIEFNEVAKRVIDTYEEWSLEVVKNALPQIIMADAVRRGIPPEDIKFDEELEEQLKAGNIDYGDIFEDPEFAIEYEARLWQSIKPRDAIERQFKYEWLPEWIEPPRVLDNSLNLEMLEEAISVAQAELDNLENDSLKKAKEIELEDMKESARIKREIEKERMEKLSAHFNEKIETVIALFSGEICKLLDEAAQDMKASLTKNGFVHPKSLQGLRTKLEKVRALNKEALNSKDLEKIIERCEVMASEAKEVGNVEDFMETLEGVSVVMRAEMNRALSASTIEVDFDIPTMPEEETELLARDILGLDEGIEIAPILRLDDEEDEEATA
jgi:hypothetical protein